MRLRVGGLPTPLDDSPHSALLGCPELVGGGSGSPRGILEVLGTRVDCPTLGRSGLLWLSLI